MTSADDPPAPARWVSFAEAQKILGLTEGTLRRAIKAGTVQGEQRRRNPDSPTDHRMVYEVLVMDAPGAVAAAAPIEAASATEAPTEPPDATTRLLDTVLAQAETIATLREQIGTLRERAESLAVERAAAMLERDELREEVRGLKDRPWWRRVWG